MPATSPTLNERCLSESEIRPLVAADVKAWDAYWSFLGNSETDDVSFSIEKDRLFKAWQTCNAALRRAREAGEQVAG